MCALPQESRDSAGFRKQTALQNCFVNRHFLPTGILKETVIGILAAVAKQPRIRLNERTIAGLVRAKAQGRIGERPRAADNPKTLHAVHRLGREVRMV